MKLHDDFYEEEREKSTNMVFVYMILIMSTIILGVTALVFWINKSTNNHSGSGYAQAVAQREERMIAEGKTPTTDSVNNISSDNKLTSDELDIWTLPDTGREENKTKKGNGTVTNNTTGETVVSNDKTDSASTTADELVDGKTSVYDVTDKENMKDESTDKNSDNDSLKSKEKDDKDDDDEEDDKKEDETRTQVIYPDGSKEWVDIDEDIEKNNYDLSKLKYQKPEMKYYVDGKEASWLGVDISANQGDVDYKKLKNAGCDFVMIKIGARGYSSGNIVLDEKYEDNLEKAQDAGLDIGVYFCSQAVTKDEAIDEVDELVNAIDDFSIKYPVAFVMENIDGDMARIEALDMEERTDIARVFMDEVDDAGYTPMIYGDKAWLMTMLDIEELEDYNVWLNQDGDKPDYPYQYGMWQYDTQGSIKGIDGDVAMSISFVDYSKK